MQPPAKESFDITYSDSLSDISKIDINHLNNGYENNDIELGIVRS